MARLFISHSSANNDKAVDVRDWLAKNGWDDVFLDLDPERGIVAGQRWKEALQKAAYRCEVVLALVSKEWLESGWCKSEIDAARLMGKKVIAALVGVDKAAVPLDFADEQFIDLTGDPQAYRRLKEGLKRTGLDPTTFPFPSDQRPYPGFAYLEEAQAAVFFGRDAQIVRGLDEIRRLARAGVTRMLVILGASGSGKSSFLRAGLWSRLKRDDLAWLPLPIVRPERAAMSGKYGLSESLFEIISEPRFADGIRQRGLPRSRVDTQDFVEKTDDGLAKLLAAIRDIAQAGLSGENAVPPTTLLAIDQGEELFNEEGRGEAKRFIDILTKTLAADPRAMAILVMRSDAFPLVQSDPALAALPKDTFTLDMMLEGSFRAVIEGPAQLVKPALAIDPQLTDALLEDISGQDALPLLAFTLAHLYENTRADNRLTLRGYDRIGRLKGVIDKTVAQAFAEAAARGEAPKDKEERLKLARSAFIPHLAQVNPAGQFVRRVAPREKIPDDARPLIDRFAEQRLLIRDRRQDAEVIEVAHEALLRQPPFSDWLAEDREFLLWRDRLTQARMAFGADERGLLAGRELAIARSYMQTRAERDFEPGDLAFIRDSVADDDKRRADEADEQRKKEAAEKEEQERRIRDAERIAEEQRKAAAAQKRSTRAALVGLFIALALAGLAGWQYFDAHSAKVKAEASAEEAKANLREAQIQQSHFLVEQAHKLGDANPVNVALLALEALPDLAAGKTRAFDPEADLLLDRVNRELRERLVLSVSSSAQATAAIRPDGLRIVAVVSGNTAQLWDVATAQPVGKEMSGHTNLILSVAFSPDGQRVVTASSDKTARVWDGTTGEPIGKPLRGHQSYVWSAAFSPDGRRIVTASQDKTVLLWNAETSLLMGAPLRGHEDGVVSAAFSPDGKRIVTASKDKTARLWDAETGGLIGELRGHDGQVNSAAFSPDGKRILTASSDTTVRVWDADGRSIGDPLKHENPVNSAAFSLDGKRIVIASSDGTAQLWDAETGGLIGEPLRGHDGQVNRATFSPDGKRILTASSDGTVRLWDTIIGKPLAGHDDGVVSVAFNRDGTRIVTASSDRTARIWNAATGEPIGSPLTGHDDRVVSAEFSPDGTRVVTASNDMTVRIWNAATGLPIAEPIKAGGNGRAAFSPDGTRIVTASVDRGVMLWNATTGESVGDPLKRREENVKYAMFSPEGQRILTLSGGLVVRIWEAATGEPRGEPIQAGGSSRNAFVGDAAFSPDGKRIITGSMDRGVLLWDAATGRQIDQPLRGKERMVKGATYSPDGKRILTMSNYDSVSIWNAATGEQIGTPISGNTAAFSPDGASIVTTSGGKTAHIWEIFADTQSRVSHAKAAVARCLTPEQREAVFLPREPPAWCIEMGKWPYRGPEWKQWLADVRAGKKPPLPAR